MNYQVRITTSESSQRHLLDQVVYLLDLMDKEHRIAGTHSQRNAFQAVIRILLEKMQGELQYADTWSEPREMRALRQELDDAKALSDQKSAYIDNLQSTLDETVSECEQDVLELMRHFGIVRFEGKSRSYINAPPIDTLTDPVETRGEDANMLADDDDERLAPEIPFGLGATLHMTVQFPELSFPPKYPTVAGTHWERKEKAGDGFLQIWVVVADPPPVSLDDIPF